MPKKKEATDQEAQSERFRETIRDAIDAGELNVTETDEAFERLTASARLNLVGGGKPVALQKGEPKL